MCCIYYMSTLLNSTSFITINNPRIFYLPTSSNPHHHRITVAHHSPRNSNSGHDKGLTFTAMSNHHHHPGSQNDVDATGESVHESGGSKSVETSCTEEHVEESSNSSREAEEDESNKRSTTGGRGNKLPIPIKLPGWAIWALGSLILLAIPFHKRILKFEGKLEQVIGAVIDDVQAAAPIVKKIAGEIADSLPKDSKLAQELEFIEKLAEEVEESADKAEAFIDKVEEIRDAIEDAVDPIIEASQKKTTKTKSD